tara:strand:+ start:225 stop:872 length:648 start_codon:yes stop_codon:yes gene_type:complete
MTKFWLNAPNVLLDRNHITEVFPDKNFSLAQKLNAITRLVIIMTILGYLFTRSIKILVSAGITLVIIVIMFKTKNQKEAFSEFKKEDLEQYKQAINTDNYIKQTFTTPTKKNPAMNVLMDEYKYNPKRPPAAPIYNDQIKKEVNENAKNKNKKLYRNLGDNILYENSMHNFYAMPNTKIPNNQKEFALFCYGNMPSCKEGDSLQCTKNNAELRTT